MTETEPPVAQAEPLLPTVSTTEKKPIIENNDKKRIAKTVELLGIESAMLELEGTPSHACGEIYRCREFQSSNSDAGPEIIV